MSDTEVTLLSGLDADARRRILSERTRAPFASVADFTSRTGFTLDRLGLTPAGQKPRGETQAGR